MAAVLFGGHTGGAAARKGIQDDIVLEGIKLDAAMGEAQLGRALGARWSVPGQP